MKRKTPMWRRYATFWKRDIDRDLQEEVEFHIGSRTQELIGSGWAPTEAEAEARRQFGARSPIVAECHRIDEGFERQKRIARYVEDIKCDAVFAIRQFRRQPKFWAVIVLTSVIGIAAATSIFAVVDGVMLKPLPYPEPARLVRPITYNYRGDFVHLGARGRTMDLAAYSPSRREVTLKAGDAPMRLRAAGVTAGLFDILGVRPILGRTFTSEEMRPAGPGIAGGTFWRTYGVVMLSAGVWQTSFGGSADVIGSTIPIDNLPHTVIGVMPAHFNFPTRDTALWFPHNIDPADPVSLWSGNVAVMIGRLRDGYELSQAREEVRTLVPSFQEFVPWRDSVNYDGYGADFDVRRLSDQIAVETRPAFMVLLATIGVVLLVLSVNMANLLLARGVARNREMATRAAMGADRRRLVRQLLVESVTVAVISGMLGAALASALLRFLVVSLPADLPRIEQIAMDGRVLLFALGVSLVTGLAFGLLPAIRVTRPRGTSLSGKDRGGVTETGEGRLTGRLAVLEFAFAAVLVVSAALLLQSLWNLGAVDPGFRVEQLVAADVSPPGFSDQEPARQRQFTQSLTQRLRSAPTVESAALANAIPFDEGLFGTIFQIEGRPALEGGDSSLSSLYFGISPGYLRTMGTRVVEGRAFTDRDRYDSPRVAVVNRRLARTYWENESPLGARIMFLDNRQGPVEDWPWFTVVGVVDDVRFDDLSSDSPPIVYLPLDQFWALDSLRVVIRSADDPSRVAASLRSIVSEVDPDTAFSDFRTYQARLDESITRPRFIAFLLAGFAGIALFLATIGVYGVLSYTMNRRIPEIGVRLAFGASSGQVFRLSFGQGMRLTLFGLALGIPAAYAVTRSLSSLLFGVDPAEPRVFAAVAIFLFLVGLAVSCFPARRAARIDPMAAIRQ